MERTSFHRSVKLDALKGRKVKILFFDGTEKTGILGDDSYSQRYSLTIDSGRDAGQTRVFYKTHIKKIKEV